MQGTRINPRSLRLLVAESEFDDIFLLQEALSEMAEGRYWRLWMRELRPAFVDRLDDALRLLGEEPFDAVLLNLTLADSEGLHTYMRMRAEAPSLPIVILTTEQDEMVAASAVREGAQDYLVKSELDCTPLARSLRHAIERQRMCESLRRLSYVDELTGLYNLGGFSALAERDLRIAARLHRPLTLLLAEMFAAEVYGASESPHRVARQERDLALMEAADLLRTSFGDTALVGRTGGDRFAVTCLDAGDCVDLETHLLARLREHNGRHTRRCRLLMRVGCATASAEHYHSLDELMNLAESTLCENRRGDLQGFRIAQKFLTD